MSQFTPMSTTGPTQEPIADNLSALAWVHDELRKSLDTAHRALRRFVKETDALAGADLDAVDPAVLRSARTQIHQAVGALELVGQSAPAMVLRASEALVQHVVTKPHKLTSVMVDDIERTSFALLDYLGRLLAGKPVSALSLFPQYRAVREACGADRVHPADLWPSDWEWHELPDVSGVAPLPADATTQAAIEAQLLPMMRLPEPLGAAAQLSDLFAGLGAGATQPQLATSWRLAGAVFESQAKRLLGFDVFSKRLAPRLLAQHRQMQRGESDVSERLAQDLLFFCSQSRQPDDDGAAPRLAAVRRAFGLDGQAPVDYAVSVLGRFDPALLAQARKRVVAAKDGWSAVAAGEMHRRAGLSEQFALVGESCKRLFPFGDLLSGEMQQTVVTALQHGTPPNAPLAMEVATSLLYVEAALEDIDFDHPEQAQRVRRLAERLAEVRKGRPPEPLDGWMEELYRRVADRQTMGSVVQELRASLSDAEKLIDQYFRDPSNRDVLIPVPHHLAAMRGVLSVLGLEQASAALQHMRGEIDGLANSDADPVLLAQTGVFDRLAGNLGALGFLIDMLSVQPQMAKSLFAYDPELGTLSPVMGRSETTVVRGPVHGAPVEPRLIEQAQRLAFSSMRDDVPAGEVARDLERLSEDAKAADQPELLETVTRAREALEQALGHDDEVTVRSELSEALVDLVSSMSESSDLGLPPESAHARISQPGSFDFVPSTAGELLAQDEEMREVFLEEANEVLVSASAANMVLRDAPGDLELLTTLRRAFHTLKGSSRMVGLTDFGDAAWACEQVYNTQLADQTPATASLLEFTTWSLDCLSSWVGDITAGRETGQDAPSFVDRAAQVGAASDASAPALVLHVPDWPSLPVADIVGNPLDMAALFGEPVEADAAADIELSFGESLVRELSPRELSFDDFSLRESEPIAEAGPASAPLHADSSFALPEFEFDEFDLDDQVVQNYNRENPVEPMTGVGDELATLDVPELLDIQLVNGFDDRATEPLPLPETIEEPFDEPSSFHIDLDFDLQSEAEPESAQAPLDLLLDLPSVDDRQDDERQGGFDPIDEADAVPAIDLAEVAAAVEREAEQSDDEHVKMVGPLRIGIPLFNIYLNEADEISRRLCTELAEWSLELYRPIGETPIALAHSLAGSSATVGFTDLSHLSRLLEHAQARSLAIGRGTPEEARLFIDAADEIRRLLHQFAAGLLKEPSPALLERLADHELSSARRLDSATAEPDMATDSVTGYLEPPETAFDLDLETGLGDEAEAGTGADADADAAVSTVVEADADIDTEAVHAAPIDVADADAEQSIPARVELNEEPDEPAELVLPEVPVSEQEPAPRSLDVDVDADAFSIATETPVHEASSEAPLAPVGSALPDSFVFPQQTFGIAELRPLAERSDKVPPATRSASVADDIVAGDEPLDAVDSVDEELFPIFAEEAAELLPQLAGHLREWARRPTDPVSPAACMRTLHTLKGGARLAGAMRLGELTHRLETRIEQVMAQPVATVDDVETLQQYGDNLSQIFEALQGIGTSSIEATGVAEAVPAVRPAVAAAQPMVRDVPAAQPADAEIRFPASASAVPANAPSNTPANTSASAPPSTPAGAMPLAEIDWTRFAPAGSVDRREPKRIGSNSAAAQSSVRVRAPLLDRLVNQAGEVSIARARIETGVSQIKASLGDLTDNLERLRAQLRDLEFQGELQMSSRLEAAKAASQTFDPLEFDRFTRSQELTRMMAESVNDVATVHHTLRRSLEATEDELAGQARMTRELQDDLLRTRMVEFEVLADRLYRVVRLASKETGKAVRLDIVGGGVEIDRGVLDRMTASFEHLLRNAVAHGIEAPEARRAAGKEPNGLITVALTQEGNEVGVEFRDDGAGLDLVRIRDKAIAQQLLAADHPATEGELANLIFAPGFSTADSVTELAGRGVGMDVVRAEVSAMGGRIETATSAGRGTSFKLILPLTTAVTQVVMVRCGEKTVAIPSTLIEAVRRATPAEVDTALVTGAYTLDERPLPFFWLGALLQTSAHPGSSDARTRLVVIVRSAQQRVAVQVDEVLGNQEVVVKNLGPQLSRLPGLAGITLLPSGVVALIYNPVALATLYGDAARETTRAAAQAAGTQGQLPVEAPTNALEAPLVMVVDDSLTVRRVTQRLLLREGYRVVLAKDGLDALERLAEVLPDIVLSDIEMPRMDGFDLVRNMRGDARLRDLPVVMITSRIAQKHRDHAASLGVDHYLGKPYAEEDLLALVSRYTTMRRQAAVAGVAAMPGAAVDLV